MYGHRTKVVWSLRGFDLQGRNVVFAIRATSAIVYFTKRERGCLRNDPYAN